MLKAALQNIENPSRSDTDEINPLNKPKYRILALSWPKNNRGLSTLPTKIRSSDHRMKVAVCAEGETLDSQASSVFGRCRSFIVVTMEDDAIADSYAIDNTATDKSGGAGTAAAQLIGEEGIDVLIARSIGPKAYSALEQWGTRMMNAESGTVRKNIHAYSSDALDPVESPSKGHTRGRGRRK